MSDNNTEPDSKIDTIDAVKLVGNSQEEAMPIDDMIMAYDSQRLSMCTNL